MSYEPIGRLPNGTVEHKSAISGLGFDAFGKWFHIPDEKNMYKKTSVKTGVLFLSKNEPGSFLHLKINPLRKMKGKEN